MGNVKEIINNVLRNKNTLTILLEFAGIKGTALFVGKGRTFQIWEKSEFEKMQQQAREKAETQRPTLSLKKD